MASSDGDGEAKSRSHKATIQISAAAMERLSQVAESTGLTRPRIIEHLILRQSQRELVRLFKAENPEPSRPGRPKMSVFRPR